MNLQLDMLFCDPPMIDQNIASSQPAPQQALTDKLSQSIPVMTMDEETVAHLAQCTVCFGSEAEVELINCGDQMCFSCLEQYYNIL